VVLATLVVLMAGQRHHRRIGAAGGLRLAVDRHRLASRATLRTSLGQVVRRRLAATRRRQTLLVVHAQSLSKCRPLRVPWRMASQLVSKTASGAAEAGAAGTEAEMVERIGSTEVEAERSGGAAGGGVGVMMAVVVGEAMVVAVALASSDEP